MPAVSSGVSRYPLVVLKVEELNTAPVGLKIEIVPAVMVEVFTLILARWPCVASNSTRPILLLVLIATVRLCPNVMRSVTNTSATT